jgi:hypothetical protein
MGKSLQFSVEERKVIDDQISVIRRQGKAYAEGTESAEFTEKRRGTEVSARKSPPFARGAKGGAPSSIWLGGVS